MTTSAELNSGRWIDDHADVLYRYALTRVRDHSLAEALMRLKKALAHGLSILGLCLGVVGCATQHHITSEPSGADVYISARGSLNSMAILLDEAPTMVNDWKNIGVTPLDVDLSKHASSWCNPLYMVEKSGYRTQRAMVDRGIGKGHHFVLKPDPRARAPVPAVVAPAPKTAAVPVAAQPRAPAAVAVAPTPTPQPVVAAVVQAPSPPIILLPVTWTTENIAVADLIAYTLSKDEVKTLSDYLHSALADTRYFRILSRSDMEEVLKTQAYSRSEACDESQCLVQMGRLLSVAKIVGGSIGRVGSTYSLSLRLVDVETGETQVTVSRHLRGEADQLLQLVEDAGRELARKYSETRKDG
jgi:hypothetical protein